MKDMVLCSLICACAVVMGFAQVEEVPAMRSKSQENVNIETKREAEVMDATEENIPAGRQDTTKQTNRYLRDFVTINIMIIIIVILMVAMVLFLIINKTRRSKQE